MGFWHAYMGLYGGGGTIVVPGVTVRKYIEYTIPGDLAQYTVGGEPVHYTIGTGE